MEQAIERKQVERLKRKLVESLGWGELDSWTHRDFQNLSLLIFESTKEQVSVTTLKRLLGKVEYHGLPYQHTLDIVAHFIGYKSWLEFCRQPKQEEIFDSDSQKQVPQAAHSPKFSKKWLWLVLVPAVSLAWLGWNMFHVDQPEKDFQKDILRSTNAFSDSVPHTVIFQYEIPDEFLNNQNIISFGEKESVAVLSNEKHGDKSISHTYTKPGYYLAKVFSNKSVLSDQPVIIETNGWKCIGYQFEMPIPMLITRKPGALTLTKFDLAHSEIDTNNKFNVGFNFYKAFSLSGDKMSFSTTLRSKPDFHNNYVPKVQLKLVFRNHPIIVSLDSSESALTIYNQFSNITVDAKRQKQLFKRSIADWSTVKVVTAKYVASVFVNGKLLYSTPYQADLGKLMGIEYRFRGNGEVREYELLDDVGTIVQGEKF